MEKLIEKYKRRIAHCEREMLIFDNPSHTHTAATVEAKTLRRVVRDLEFINSDLTGKN